MAPLLILVCLARIVPQGFNVEAVHLEMQFVSPQERWQDIQIRLIGLPQFLDIEMQVALRVIMD